MLANRTELIRSLHHLGIVAGDTIMVHASLRAIGPVDGGPAELAAALSEVVGPAGTLMTFVSWNHSPYDATLNGRELSAAERDAWPAFNPSSAEPYQGFGALNRFLMQLPGSQRSDHPDASIWACGAAASHLVAPHPLGSGFGPGSPLERFVGLDGKVLLLGAPPDAVTVLHYAEACAKIPGKRRVRYSVPVLDTTGQKSWHDVEELDTNGILDCYAEAGGMDAVERIARDYLRLGRHRSGRVGAAECQLIDAGDIVRFGVEWLEDRHGDDI